MRLKERLRVEEDHVDNLRASLKKVVRSAKFENKQTVLDGKDFNELWNQLHYLGCKYNTYSELLDERLTYGWLTCAAFDLFRSKDKSKTLREKVERLYEAVIGIAKFEGWDKKENEKLTYNANDLINKIKEI